MKCSNCLQICFFHPRQNPALPIYTSSINVCHILFEIFLVLIIIFGRGSMLNEIQCSKLVLSNNYTDSISFTYVLKLTIGCIDLHSHQFVIIFYRPPLIPKFIFLRRIYFIRHCDGLFLIRILIGIMDKSTFTDIQLLSNESSSWENLLMIDDVNICPLFIF